jgi:AraC-like DNA-binding protein
MGLVSISVVSTVFSAFTLLLVFVIIYFRSSKNSAFRNLAWLNVLILPSMAQIVLVDYDLIPEGTLGFFVFNLIPQLCGHAFAPLLWFIFTRIKQTSFCAPCHFSIWLLDVFLTGMVVSQMDGVSSSISTLEAGTNPLYSHIYNASVLLQLMVYGIRILRENPIFASKNELLKSQEFAYAKFSLVIKVLVGLYVVASLIFVTIPQFLFDFMFIQLIYNVQALFLGAFFLRNPKLFAPSAVKSDTLSESDVQLLKHIADGVTLHHWHLDPDLDLDTLAAHCFSTPTKISAVINAHFKCSVSAFINQKRVEYALSKLKTENLEQTKIEAIGLQSGFRSKASFYRVFKQVTGKTPSQCIQRSGA